MAKKTKPQDKKKYKPMIKLNGNIEDFFSAAMGKEVKETKKK